MGDKPTIANENVACKNMLQGKVVNGTLRRVDPLRLVAACNLLLEHATRPSQLGEQTGERGGWSRSNRLTTRRVRRPRRAALLPDSRGRS